MEQIKATIDNIMKQFVAFLDDLVNKYLKDIKIELF